MEQAFWLMWKLATPILAVAVALLLIERRQQRRRADGLWQSIEAYRNEKHDLVVKLAEAQLDAAEAKSLRAQEDVRQAVYESMRSQAYWTSKEITEGRQRIAYLTERNEQLILNALATNTREYIKIHPN